MLSIPWGCFLLCLKRGDVEWQKSVTTKRNTAIITVSLLKLKTVLKGIKPEARWDGRKAISVRLITVKHFQRVAVIRRAIYGWFPDRRIGRRLLNKGRHTDMENEKMLSTAIELLKDIDLEKVEIVQVDNTKYDDGSVGFAVDITFPAEEGD